MRGRVADYPCVKQVTFCYPAARPSGVASRSRTLRGLSALAKRVVVAFHMRPSQTSGSRARMMLFHSHPLHRGLSGALDLVPSAVLTPARPFHDQFGRRFSSEEGLQRLLESLGLQKLRDVSAIINARPSGRRGPQVRGNGVPFGVGERRFGGHAKPVSVGPPSARLARSRSPVVILRALK